MNFKRQVHTLHVKHDNEFRTLSKIALAQLLLKLIHLKSNGALMRQIKTQLGNVIIGNVSQREIDDAIHLLVREEKIRISGGRHYIHEKFRDQLQDAETKTEKLHIAILERYFGSAASPKESIRNWFQDTTIKFFETFSFEWFYQITYKKKQTAENVPSLKETLARVLENAEGIVQEDKEWLRQQYNKFIDSEGQEENLLFWQYGISMFSSRLITARNYADEISIELFKDSRFILDTNILMILDLEGHELNGSLRALEKVLQELNITPVYFTQTRDEYLRAMHWRKNETIKVFNNYNRDVLKESDCPFIQTALKRHCETEEDLGRMFDQLMDMPRFFHDSVPLDKFEYSELSEAILEGENNQQLKDSINEVYKRRFSKRQKREKPLVHDAGLVSGARFLEKSEKCWIVTSDSTLKLFAIENTVRDKNEIAIGLDVIIGVMAISCGGINIEASNFAPLFKNIIKYSLIPESTAFEVQDLAFMLSSNTKVHELSDEIVIDVARIVKKKRISGEDDESISLYLRRVIEGEKIGLMKDIQEVKDREQLSIAQKNKAEKEKGIFIETFRKRRIGELQDQYKHDLRMNRWKLVSIPLIVAALLFFTVKYWAVNIDGRYQFLVGCVAEAIFSLIIAFPFNKKFVRKYSEYVTQIEEKVDSEIEDLINKAKN